MAWIFCNVKRILAAQGKNTKSLIVSVSKGLEDAHSLKGPLYACSPAPATLGNANECQGWSDFWANMPNRLIFNTLHCFETKSKEFRGDVTSAKEGRRGGIPYNKVRPGGAAGLVVGVVVGVELRTPAAGLLSWMQKDHRRAVVLSGGGWCGC